MRGFSLFMVFLLHSRSARAADDGVLRLCAMDAFLLQRLVAVHVGMDEAFAQEHPHAKEQETQSQEAADEEEKSEHEYQIT